MRLVPWRRRRNGSAESVATELEPLVRLRDELRRAFDRFFTRPLAGPWSDWNWGLELEDREDEVVVRLDAPGFDPEDFEVRLSGNLLTIRARREEEQRRSGMELRRYGLLRRAITLPPGIDPDQAEATYRRGVLEVRVRKKPQEARGRRVPVKSS